ncbi:glycosyltransferase family 4 protein [Thermoanaerobacter mathranii]|uniref:glycosyltransferase family 4 protein n=1 Tax=Thermoanaerobacter mathranii TaxID=583357 RepID=UPI003D6C517E
MRILYLTNIFPYSENPVAGIFITRRIEKLIERKVDFEAYATVVKHSTLSKYVYLLKNKSFYVPEPEVKKQNKSMSYYNYIIYQLNIYDYFTRLIDKDRYYKRLQAKFFRIIENNIDISKFDLIHAHPTYPTGYIALLFKEKYGIPYVVTAHGSDIHTYPKTNLEIRKNTLEILNHADKAIFVSKKLLDIAASVLGYKGNNSIVIPNGVDVRKFIPMDKFEIREKFQLSTNYKYVGFIGNLIPIKNAQLLPEIFNLVKKSYNSVKFIVIGDGELYNYIHKKCQEHNLEVIFTGRIPHDDIPIWLNTLDVLVLPSAEEGWGNVILEALACGVPTVGSNAGGIPEVIGSEEFGRVVELKENFVNNFANNVVELLNRPLLPEKLRERALQYSWENIIDRELEVYKSVVNKTSRE